MISGPCSFFSTLIIMVYPTLTINSWELHLFATGLWFLQIGSVRELRPPKRSFSWWLRGSGVQTELPLFLGGLILRCMYYTVPKVPSWDQVRVAHSGKWHESTPFIGCLPFPVSLPHSPLLVFPRTTSQINFQQLNPRPRVCLWGNSN